MRLGIIGGGTMGEAIITAILNNGVAGREDIRVCDALLSRRDYLNQTYALDVTEDALEAAAETDLVLLAVKPQDFEAAAEGLAGQLLPGQAVVSIMAGVRIETISELLRHEAVVRAIPNTAAQIGEGVTVWTATKAVSAPALDAVREVLSVLGLEFYVSDEKYVDMATAVASSGPAYIFLVIEALIDAAVHIGLRREMAREMVVQMALGSARIMQESNQHPARLRNQVTSPGGTTTEALLVLERAGVRAAFIEAVEAAYEKAQLLGG